MKIYQCLFVLHFVFLLHRSICLQMETAKDTWSAGRYHYNQMPVPKDENVLKMVEQQFLDFLGLKERPRKSSGRNVIIPDHLWKLFYKWSDDNYEDHDKNNADRARVLHHSVEVDHDSRSTTASTQTLYFNISDVQPKETLHRAELLLFSERHGHTSKKQIRIYRNKTDYASDKHHPFVLRKFRQKKVGYVSLDVTSYVMKWLNNSIGDTSLFVDVDEGNSSGNTVHLRRRRDMSSREWHQKRPLLVVYTQTSSPMRIKSKESRKRRSAYHIKHNKDYKLRNETHQRVRLETCRLRPFRLNFKTLGWNEWIISPTDYDINYCSGHCPRPLGPHFNTTNHAVIQNSILSLGGNRVPPLCCIPTTLKDQALLHLTSDERLQLINPVQMTALGCGCR